MTQKLNRKNTKQIMKNTFLVLTASSANFTNAMPSAVTCYVVEGEKHSVNKPSRPKGEKEQPNFNSHAEGKKIVCTGLMPQPA